MYLGQNGCHFSRSDETEYLESLDEPCMKPELEKTWFSDRFALHARHEMGVCGLIDERRLRGVACVACVEAIDSVFPQPTAVNVTTVNQRLERSEKIGCWETLI